MYRSVPASAAGKKCHVAELLPSVLAMRGLGGFAWSVDMKEATVR